MVIKYIAPNFNSLIKGISVCALLLFFFINTAQCQNKDTTYIYFKQSKELLERVSTIDSADFIRVLYPVDKSNNTIPVKQFYKNGRVNFVGAYELRSYSTSIVPKFVGDYISFFPNGKKQISVHFTDGHMDGVEYFFYENGSVYCSEKHTIVGDEIRPEIKYWDFFDVKGQQLCKQGNGEWILYDAKLKPIAQGAVKNGLFDGEWRGKTFEADSINYSYTYKNGSFISGTGYRFGKAYPFKDIVEHASVTNAPFRFITKLRGNFKVPKSAKVNENLLDTISIRFIIEADGHFSNPEFVGNGDPVLKLALQNALDKCTEEQPSKYYGVPLRLKITMPFKAGVTTTSTTINYIKSRRQIQTPILIRVADEPISREITQWTTVKSVNFSEEILGFN